jgi:hypothetical protein
MSKFSDPPTFCWRGRLFTVDLVLGTAAVLLASVALWVALHLRMTGIDQPYLMILAQEALFGHHQELIDFPSSVFIHAPAIFAFRWFGWPIVFSWNLFVAILCGISACIFAFRMNTRYPGTLLCLWFGLVLLLFDDTLLGQREFLFSIFWFPYVLARFSKPENAFYSVLDALCGALLSVVISAKFYFAAFVLLIDIPILLLRRGRQSYVAFWALVIGGTMQTAIFLMQHGADIGEIKSRLDIHYGIISSVFLRFTLLLPLLRWYSA